MLLLAIGGLSAREMVDASYLFDRRLFFGQDGSGISYGRERNRPSFSPESNSFTIRQQIVIAIR